MSGYDAITDVPGIKVGHWTNRRAATGCTVVLYEPGAVGGVDVRGGAASTHETDILRPGHSAPLVNAIVLTGGSTYGLEATAGVMRWCEEHGIGQVFGGRRIPIVAGAVLFDLNVGHAEIRPDVAAGYRAAAGAKGGRVIEGSVGAGTGATVAKIRGRGRSIKAGLGTASESLAGGIVIGALVAVNAVGDVVDSRNGRTIAAPRGEDGAFLDTMAWLREHGVRIGNAAPAPNTTIGVIATNATLTKEQTNRLASIAHDGMARAIRPVHTNADGDTLFVLATGEVAAADYGLSLEAFAPVVVERAILKAVRAATSLAGIPAVRDLPKPGRDV